MIEDVIGIARLEERKAKALRTLNAAEQKIEVAMARTGEQRAVLESFDSQRNDLTRYNLLEAAQLLGETAVQGWQRPPAAQKFPGSGLLRSDE